MKRDIKFRGQSMQSDEWIYGSLLITDDNKNNPMQQRLPRKRHQIVHYFAGDWNMGGWSAEDVYQNSIGQFTGLKDKNGTDIYEDDIVKRTVNMRNYAECDGEVVEYFEVQYEAPNWYPFRDISEDMSEYEVIGNIYDNPELINE